MIAYHGRHRRGNRAGPWRRSPKPCRRRIERSRPGARRPSAARFARSQHAGAVPLRVARVRRIGRPQRPPGVASRSVRRRSLRLPSAPTRAPPRGLSARSARPSAPSTVTRAPPILPPMMASAAFCRSSLAKRRAGAAGRLKRSPTTIAPRSSRRRPYPGAPGAGANRTMPPSGAARSMRQSPVCCFRVACDGQKRRQLRWGEVSRASDGAWVLVRVRRSKTDQ